jgi:Aminotransferase class I and II
MARRKRVAGLAARHGLWIIEDDPYSELRYRGVALAAIATLPGADDRTLSLSTLSKTVAPGLRIGWIRTPPELRPSLVIAKQAADLHSSSVDQAAAAHWLGHVDLDAHVARLCAAYGERRAARRARGRAPACAPLGIPETYVRPGRRDGVRTRRFRRSGGRAPPASPGSLPRGHSPWRHTWPPRRGPRPAHGRAEPPVGVEFAQA